MSSEISLIAQVLLTASALRRDAKVLGSSLEDHAADLERAALREDKGSEYDEAIAALRRMRDGLDESFPTVFGVPCSCDTPALHSDDCVRIRAAYIAAEPVLARAGVKA